MKVAGCKLYSSRPVPIATRLLLYVMQ